MPFFYLFFNRNATCGHNGNSHNSPAAFSRNTNTTKPIPLPTRFPPQCAPASSPASWKGCQHHLARLGYVHFSFSSVRGRGFPTYHIKACRVPHACQKARHDTFSGTQGCRLANREARSLRLGRVSGTNPAWSGLLCWLFYFIFFNGCFRLRNKESAWASFDFLSVGISRFSRISLFRTCAWANYKVGKKT